MTRHGAARARWRRRTEAKQCGLWWCLHRHLDLEEEHMLATILFCNHHVEVDRYPVAISAKIMRQGTTIFETIRLLV